MHWLTGQSAPNVDRAMQCERISPLRDSDKPHAHIARPLAGDRHHVEALVQGPRLRLGLRSGGASRSPSGVACAGIADFMSASPIWAPARNGAEMLRQRRQSRAGAGALPRETPQRPRREAAAPARVRAAAHDEGRRAQVQLGARSGGSGTSDDALADQRSRPASARARLDAVP